MGDDFKDMDWSNPDPEKMKKFQEKLKLGGDFDPSKFKLPEKDEPAEEKTEEVPSDDEPEKKEEETPPTEEAKSEEKEDEPKKPKIKIVKRGVVLNSETKHHGLALPSEESKKAQLSLIVELE